MKRIILLIVAVLWFVFNCSSQIEFVSAFVKDSMANVLYAVSVLMLTPVTLKVLQKSVIKNTKKQVKQ